MTTQHSSNHQPMQGEGDIHLGDFRELRSSNSTGSTLVGSRPHTDGFPMTQSTLGLRDDSFIMDNALLSKQAYSLSAPPALAPVPNKPRARRANRTTAEMQADEAALALYRQEKSDKAAFKAAEARIKATQKAAQNIF
ncbi:uncharacterized protein PGTG_06231 [Puccinia graminis f. sp. tritici CRL 75-36-700-3]|uniref:No apical meristem-associated C-terminal domain-containing protein n=1 Tax=Puccinia graminis f. sp. tritici (strain CRL 75-36-700-3 / race SCCL) TaxID=418459 RepID=E3K7F1_PUCGT|nr:uncharacterized protein PGTG_06231 [Puccinia graminis f. sp. tritici CRL 75-36-700-3]EFP80275.1 hypothetical protein PGTG_06231 [Puccinia graminis f. sp. tritici CRL 75-36-700-3]